MTENNPFYNRCAPLLERKHVPIQLIDIPTERGKNGVDSSALPKRRAFFTLRVLQGHRPTPGFAGSTERAIRLELSNEYGKIEERIGINSIDNARADKRFDMGYASPNLPKQRNINNAYHNCQGPIHFPSLHRTGAGSKMSSHVMGLPISTRPVRDKAQDEGKYDATVDVNSAQRDNTPIQLYELEVGESDFAQLRQDQALLVDFTNFSKSFIKLLMSCDLGDSEMSPSQVGECKQNESPLRNPLSGFSPMQSSNPCGALLGGTLDSADSNFICRIEDYTQSRNNTSWTSSSKKNEDLAIFSIVESNQFRELVHLSLSIKPGTDASVRSYLSTRMSEVIGQNTVLNYQLANQKEGRESAEKACNDIAQRYNELVQMSESEKVALVQEADESLQRENKKRCEEIQRAKHLNEEDVLRLRESMAEMKESLQSRIDRLESENKQLRVDINEKMSNISSLEKDRTNNMSELDEAKQEIAKSRKELLEGEEERTLLDHKLGQSKSFISELESSNEQYEEKLVKSQNELSQAKDEIFNLKRAKEEQSKRLIQVQQQLTVLNDEYTKSKDLLGRYQRDRQEMKRRMKSKVEMIQKQEEILSSKEISSTEIQERLLEREMEYRKVQEDLAVAKMELDKANDHLNENKKTMTNNQQVSKRSNCEGHNYNIEASI